MFEDLTYEELRRRSNTQLPERLAARLQAHGERRTVAVGEVMYRTDDRDYPFVYCISASVRVCDPMGMVLGVMGPGSSPATWRCCWARPRSPTAPRQNLARWW